MNVIEANNIYLKQFKTSDMKKFFTLSLFALLTGFLLAGCVKERYTQIDESYWLSKERGEVVYSDGYCNYYVVDTYNGYAVLRSYGGYKPLEGSILYGNFSNAGTRDIYNRSAGVIMTGTVTDYWLTYASAQSVLDYYCPQAKAIPEKK
jgi:hypothetical protein